MKIKQDQIIEIEWLDSMHDSGWMDRKRAIERSSEKGLTHKTIGYLLQETKYSICVYQSRGTITEFIDAVMEIPKVAIKKIKKL